MKEKRKIKVKFESHRLGNTFLEAAYECIVPLTLSFGLIEKQKIDIDNNLVCFDKEGELT